MAKLIYAAIASLDGYIEDESGKFAAVHRGGPHRVSAATRAKTCACR
jgi:hypothetical protein